MTYWEGWNHWYPQKYVEFVFWSISRDFGQSDLLAWAVLLQCGNVIETSLSNIFNGNFMFSKVFILGTLARAGPLKRKFVERKEFYFDLNVKFNFSSLSLRWAVLLWPSTFDNIPLHCRPLFYQISQGIKQHLFVSPPNGAIGVEVVGFQGYPIPSIDNFAFPLQINLT